MYRWKLHNYSCMFANKINQLKAICVAFVFMINFNMQFIGEVY